MKSDETQYKTKQKYPLVVWLILLLLNIIFIAGLSYGIIKVYKAPLTQTDFFQTTSTKALVLFLLSFILFFYISTIIGSTLGKIKGKRFIYKENKAIKKTNPYIYYRELPNNYGIGVTSLLFDSKIENEKDIIAVVLDLCAKKYLSLNKEMDKYFIKILKPADEHLLDNEKYILNLVQTNNLKNINYKEWFKYCLEDGKKLNLYYHQDEEKKKSNFDNMAELKKMRKAHLITSIAIATLFGFGSGFLNALLAFILAYVLLFIPFYVLYIIKSVIKIGKNVKNSSYYEALNNHLLRTNKGVEELQKLISFKNFLSDFGNFVDKNPEEVILWDRYLSFAQVFGLTDEIMKSGYNQIVKNASFQIDNFNNINLNNIEIA